RYAARRPRSAGSSPPQIAPGPGPGPSARQDLQSAHPARSDIRCQSLRPAATSVTEQVAVKRQAASSTRPRLPAAWIFVRSLLNTTFFLLFPVMARNCDLDWCWRGPSSFAPCADITAFCRGRLHGENSGRVNLVPSLGRASDDDAGRTDYGCAGT